MKRFTFLSAILITLVVSSCKTTKSSASGEADDRYYSLTDARKERRQAQKLIDAPADQRSTNPTNSYSDNSTYTNPSYQQIPDQTPATSNTNNSGSSTGSFDMDDSYDYMYASRIRRFQRPVISYNYYNPFYTNMYWYNYDPFSYGTSIYSTYNFFNPYTPWGWNSWNTPGINFGWSNYGGSYMNFGMGYNPYNYYNPHAYYNPWRWNSWGYNPCFSPFAYNPFMYSPYGFGNGYAAGYSHGYMNGMINGANSNSSYFNSFDTNSHYYGKDNGGAGSGGSSSLSQNFTQQIGSNYAVNSLGSGGKYAAPGSSIENGNNLSTLKAGSPGNAIQGNSSNKNTNGKPSQADKYTSINSQNQPNSVSDQKANSSKISGIESANAPNGGRVSAPNTVQSNAINQKDRTGLIQSGVISSNSTKAVATNYTSAPVQLKNSGLENSPAADFNRQPTISPAQASQSSQVGYSNNPQRLNQTPSTIKNQGTAVRSTPYLPNYDYSNGVRSNETNRVSTPANIQNNRLGATQPATTTPAVNRNSYQQNNYQNYTAPQQPRNSYQSPVQRGYSAPAQERNNMNRNSAPPPQRDYSVPQQQNRINDQQQNRSNQPQRNNYNPPVRQDNTPRHSEPRQEQTRPMNNAPRMDNSPRMNSGNGNNSGGRMNSPRR